MKTVKDAISACRHCRFYHSEGRRGGNCQQLGVPVQGSWKPCALAVQPFASQWDGWSGIASRHLSNPDPQPVVAAETSRPALTMSELGSAVTVAMIEEIFLSVE